MISSFRTVIVIGENHDEIIKKYSFDTKVRPWCIAKLDDAQNLHGKRIAYLKKAIQSAANDNQKSILMAMLEDTLDMTDFEFYQEVTKGCRYDEETGDAYTDENPNAYYKYERCPQKRLLATGEEADFSNPFKLKDGSVSYIAKVGEIDWSLMHMYNTELYQRAWELAVNDAEPLDEQEKRIKRNMSQRKKYFENFADCDEYVRHSCSFWAYGIATEEWYKEAGHNISDKEWVSTFYDRFIKSLPEDMTLAIYEVKSLD